MPMRDRKIEYIKLCCNPGNVRTDFTHNGNDCYLKKSFGYPVETPIGTVAIEKDGKLWIATLKASGFLLSKGYQRTWRTKKGIIKYCKSLSWDNVSAEAKRVLDEYSKLLEENKEKAQ